MPSDSRYSAITATPLLVFPCWQPYNQLLQQQSWMLVEYIHLHGALHTQFCHLLPLSIYSSNFLYVCHLL